MFDEIDIISENPDNKIVGVSIDENEIVFLVSEKVDAQKNIPSVVDGRDVKVLLSL